MKFVPWSVALLGITACQGSKVSSRAAKLRVNAAATSTTGTETTTSITHVQIETVGAPTFSPAADTYNTPQTITMVSPTQGATLYYTTDGSTPTTSSTLYSGTVTVSSSQTIKVLAVKTGAKDSAVATAEYIITGTVAAPTITPAAGTYTTTQSVTLNTITSGATIYYTIDGSTPTTSSTMYSGTIAVSASQTLKAFAVKAASTDSSIASAAYVITGTVATPSFSVAAGTYASAQAVTITSATPGATLYYTTDGSTPTTASAVYSSAITVTASQTLKALAVKATWDDSAVAAAAYIITGTVAAPTFTPATGTYTTAQSVTLSTITSGATIYYTADGSTPTTASTVYSGAITVSASQTLKAFAVKAASTDSSVTSSAYVITGTVATPSFSIAAGTYTSSQSLTITSATAGATLYYTTDGSTPTTSSTVYSGAVAVASSQTLKALAIKATWDDSAVGSAAYVITGTVATPSFSVAAGTYTSSQTVTITSATAGATIYYTTDGGTPTTSSSLYSSAVTVSASQTLKVLAVKATWADSAVGSAAYVITGIVATPSFSIAAGTYGGSQSVTISSTTAGATIYYTSDGSSPTTSSTLYSGAITVSASQVLKAFAVKASWADSAVATAAYVIDTTPPTITYTSVSPASPHWNASPTITVSMSEAASVVLYSNVGCTTSLSSAASLSAGAGQTISPTSLPALVTTAIYAKAIDLAGNASTCTSLLSYTTVLKFDDPDPSAGNGFGQFGVYTLPNGNVVIASPYADMGGATDSGALYLFNGTTGALISTLYGTHDNDGVGYNVEVLTNGNFIVESISWNTGAGAVTWGSASTGVSGPVSATNSLIGTSDYDNINVKGVLSNGNYLAGSSIWDCTVAAGCSSTITDVGAVVLGSGTTGVVGTVSTANSLVGASANDRVGYKVYPLSNGNYVVASYIWDCTVTAGCSGAIADVGAVTWGSGTSGVTGFVTTTNSLVGSTVNDSIGQGVTPLTNGNYVISSQYWDCKVASGCSGTLVEAGAATWASGTTGIAGTISTSNSLVGQGVNDQVGASITPLTNGNYVVSSTTWDCKVAAGCSGAVTNVGAVTWASGTTGIAGFITSTNSLIGRTVNDNVGGIVTPLSNGNYVVTSAAWYCTVVAGCSSAFAAAGAVTWGSGTAGVAGFVSTTNSLVGSTLGDNVGIGGVLALTNGNYVVASQYWDCKATAGCSGTIADVGAVTWCSGTTGRTGTISTSNSLVGSTASDKIGAMSSFGYPSLYALTNGNYVVGSPLWDCTVGAGCSGTIADVGAVTWGSGTAGITGAITSMNSLLGSTTLDLVGDAVSGQSAAIYPLSNGNYVVGAKNWNCPAAICGTAVGTVGAVTWGSGTSGVSGFITAANSLIGSAVGDSVSDTITTLSNGNYLVNSINWDCTTTRGCATNTPDSGAFTWGSGTSGATGFVSASNSIVGLSASINLWVSGGNYFIQTVEWNSGNGLLVFFPGTVTTAGQLPY